MSISTRLLEIKKQLPSSTQLVAVSKYHSKEEILEAYNAGQRIFGENHVQELTQKEAALPKDIQWHFIGHLQTNKVKYIAPFITLIHAVDSYKLLKEINKQAQRHNRIISCLLQLHIAQEETKFGLTLFECDDLLKKGEWKDLKNIEISGLMCMASHTDNKEQIAKEFSQVQNFFVTCKEKYFPDSLSFKECSWGMSHDYPIAVNHGSTLVRIGTSIFGEREY